MTTPNHELVRMIGSVFQYIADKNANVDVPVDPSNCFAFDWTYEWIEIEDYLDRIDEWIDCGGESYFCALCLIQRLDEAGALPPLNQRTLNRVFFVCLMLSVKMLEDVTLNNKDFAKVGCVTLEELNTMELFSLKALNFNAHVDKQAHNNCKKLVLQASLFHSISARAQPLSSSRKPLTLTRLMDQISTISRKPFESPRRPSSARKALQLNKTKAVRVPTVSTDRSTAVEDSFGLSRQDSM